MARKDRTGNRKTRDQRSKRRVPEMGYYLVVTDTEGTERCFFNGMHDSLPDDMKKKLVIKVLETKTQNLIQKCLEFNFDQIIQEAERAGIHVGWSNPCFEIWMFAYFGNMPVIQDSWVCCSRFGDLYRKKTGQDYSKTDATIYKRLCENGDEEKAFSVAEQKYQQCLREGKDIPSKMCPATRVHELVGEIKRKVQ